MANKKINQLVSKTAILSTDIFGIGDATTGQLFKKTIAELQAAIGGAVISVNGLVGTVVLDTDDIQELATPTNKYFTDARARGAISLTVTGNSGASTYSSGTGVLNVPTYTLAGLGGISATFLSGTSGISYNSTTGVISYSGTVYTDASIRSLFSGATGISYNSSTGAISYSGTVYTDSSIRALISMTTTGDSGASTYNNTTGVINVPNYTLAGLGGISYTSLSGGTGITYNNTTGAISYSGTVYTDASVRALISASGAVSYNNTTGVISLTSGNLTEATSSVLTITGGTGAVLGSGTSIQVKQASSTVSGFLSSTDWSTFNGKASALSGTTNYVAKFTSSSAIGNSLIYDDGTQLAINVASPSSYGTQKFLIVSSAASQIARFTDGTNGDLVFDFPSSTVSRITAQYGTGGNLVFANGTGFTERMRITSAGNINLYDQKHQLAFYNAGNFQINFGQYYNGTSQTATNTDGGRLIMVDGGFTFKTFTGGTVNSTVADSERMRITSAGNVGINTSSPQTQLHVSISAGAFTAQANTIALFQNDGTTSSIARVNIVGGATGFSVLDFGDTNTYNVGGITYNHTSNLLAFTTNAVNNRMTITSGGNILMNTTSDNGERLYVDGTIRATGTITANSDISLKKNLLRIENALEKVEQINGYTYEFKEDDSKRHAGVIAQEIQTVLPEIVNKGNDGILGVEYGNISALLIEAIKEQNTKIKNLETLLASK